MKLVLFGARGMIGSRILKEALRRGHAVTAVVRDPAKFDAPAGVAVMRGDVLDAESVATAVRGRDAALSAVGPGADVVRGAAPALLAGMARAGVKRLVVVGGAGSLEVAPGKQLVDSPDFPPAYKPVALAHRDALEVYRKNRVLEWSCLSPAGFISPGARTGRFRLGGDQLLTDAKGESRISAEDYAVALLDEVEKPRHVRRRFTVAY